MDKICPACGRAMMIVATEEIPGAEPNETLYRQVWGCATRSLPATGKPCPKFDWRFAGDGPIAAPPTEPTKPTAE